MSSEKRRKEGKNSLGERLLSIRGESGLTLGEFAKSLGMKSGAYFSDLENDVKSTLSNKLIKKICELYHISPNWLLTGNGGMNYSSDFQTTNGVNAKKTPSGEDIRMTETQMIAIVEELTRLKIRIEQLESQCPGYQKKNQQR